MGVLWFLSFDFTILGFVIIKTQKSRILLFFGHLLSVFFYSKYKKNENKWEERIQ
jgi:hypothetical protein